MSTALLFVFALVLVAALTAMLFIVKSSQANVQSGLKLIKDNFDSLERSYDLKSSTLRSEISESMQNSRKELQAGLMQTTQLLEQKVTSLDTKLDTRIGDLTKQVGSKLEQNLKEGFLHFEKIQTHLKQAEQQLLNLNTVGCSINELNNLLKLPHLRGNFGEAMLENLLSDLLPRDSFELQHRIVPNSTERVDAIIRYPGCILPIDSKFPREQVLPLFETNEPAALEIARKDLATVMKTLARSIKEKYIHPEHGTTEMALLFVPSETLYFEVIRNVSLNDDLSKLKVFVVSPNTLSVTLHSISLARNYYEMAKGVEKTITEVKKAQQHFKNFEGRFEEIGTALNKAQAAFNTAATHLGRYESAVTRLGAAELTTEIPTSLPS